MNTHAISAREQDRIIAALRHTTARVPQIAADAGRTSETVKRIAWANGISVDGRA